MWRIDVKSQQGGILVQGLIIITFLAVFGLTLATMISIESRSHIRDAASRQAYYLAVSGLEYGVKRFLMTGYPVPASWEEELVWPDSQKTRVELDVLEGNRVRITSRGRVHGFSQTLVLEARYLDLSGYAVVAGGSVEGVTVVSLTGKRRKSGDRILEHAPRLPQFDREYFEKQSRSKRFRGKRVYFQVTKDLKLKRPYRWGIFYTYVEGDVILDDDLGKLSRFQLYRNWWGIVAPDDDSRLRFDGKRKGKKRLRLPGMLIMAGDVRLQSKYEDDDDEDKEEDHERSNAEAGEHEERKKKRKKKKHPGDRERKGSRTLIVYYHPDRSREFLKASINESPLLLYDIQKQVIH
ncbi:MAG: hypothetical protein GXO78_13055 [Calditrichaeota bacterium]|nr:hypothetical protein [Calditrichota bacterium]